MSQIPLLADATKPIYELLDVSGLEALVARLILAALLLLATALASKWIQRCLVRRIKVRDAADQAALLGYRRFVRIVMAVIGISLATHALGVNLLHVFTAGGLLAVAFAFAAKSLAENLVSGLILRAEGVIHRGDVLQLEDGRVVRVERIGTRATTVRTKPEQDLIIPNTDLAQSAVANFSHHDSLCRVDVTVGVAYESDLRAVRACLEKLCAKLEWKSDQKDPRVSLHEFGSSSVDFRVLVWMEDPWAAGLRRAQLLEAIWWNLKDAGITIPFPQLDVHVGETPGSASGGEVEGLAE